MIRRLVICVVLFVLALGARWMMNSSAGIPTDVDDSAPNAEVAVASAQRAPDWLRDPTADAALGEQAAALLSAEAPAERSCMVMSRNGDVFVDVDEHNGLYAGDLHRLVTAAALNDVALGFGYRTTVAVAQDATLNVDVSTEEATLIGNIWIIGSGDPSLSTGDYAARFETERQFTSFDELAAATVAELQARGVVAITGRVVGDESKYNPPQRSYLGERVFVNGSSLPVWTSSQNDGRIGTLSGLLVNDGFVEYSEPGQPVDPSQNVATTNPAAAAAAALDDALEAAGISVSASPTSGLAPPATDRETIAEIQSAPLDEIIVDGITDLTTAEMLLKEFGIRSGSSSERALAASALVASASNLQLDVDDRISFVDGSGRSLANRTTCEVLHRLIASDTQFVSEHLPQSESCGYPSAQLRVMTTRTDTSYAALGWRLTANGDRVAFATVVDDQGRLSRGDEASAPFAVCDSFETGLFSLFDTYPLGPSLDQLAPPAADS